MGLKNKLIQGLDVGMNGSRPSALPTHEGRKTGSGGFSSDDIEDRQFNGESYRYLPFEPRSINWCEADGVDVLSSKFTGCIMAVYTVSGRRRVCHVSTDPVEALDCKTKWNDFKNGMVSDRPDPGSVIEFKPSKEELRTEIPRGKTKTWIPLPDCYGLITRDSACYTITLAWDTERQTRVVVGVKQYHPSAMGTEQSSLVAQPAATGRPSYLQAVLNWASKASTNVAK